MHKICFLYSFWNNWALGLFPHLGYCEQYCNEYSSTDISWSSYFFLGYIYPDIGLLDYIVALFYYLLRKIHIIFLSDSTLHFHQQCTKMSFSQHPYQHLFSPVPLIMAILTGLMNLKIYIHVTYSFLIELFAYFSLLSCKSSLCSWNINSLSEYGLEISSPISLLAFSFFLIVSFDM